MIIRGTHLLLTTGIFSCLGFIKAGPMPPLPVPGRPFIPISAPEAGPRPPAGSPSPSLKGPPSKPIPLDHSIPFPCPGPECSPAPSPPVPDIQDHEDSMIESPSGPSVCEDVTGAFPGAFANKTKLEEIEKTISGSVLVPRFGPEGKKGPTGDRGRPGITEDRGRPGIPGTSVLGDAIDNDYILISRPRPPGPPGPPGPVCPNCGPPGPSASPCYSHEHEDRDACCITCLSVQPVPSSFTTQSGNTVYPVQTASGEPQYIIKARCVPGSKCGTCSLRPALHRVLVTHTPPNGCLINLQDVHWEAYFYPGACFCNDINYSRFPPIGPTRREDVPGRPGEAGPQGDKGIRLPPPSTEGDASPRE